MRLILVARSLLGLGAVTLVLGLYAMYGAELAEEPAGATVGGGFCLVGTLLLGLGLVAGRVRASVRHSTGSRR